MIYIFDDQLTLSTDDDRGDPVTLVDNKQAIIGTSVLLGLSVIGFLTFKRIEWKRENNQNNINDFNKTRDDAVNLIVTDANFDKRHFK